MPPDGLAASDREGALLASIANGDEAAFAAFFGLVAPRIKSYFQRKGLDPAAAEELTQDVMVKVWRKAPVFEPMRGTARAWVFGIARNRWVDHVRTERSAVTYGIKPPDRAADAADDNAPGGDSADRDRLIKDAVATLPPGQREVVVKAFFSDQSHGEISSTLAMPLGTVKSRMRLALAKLRRSLRVLR